MDKHLLITHHYTVKQQAAVTHGQFRYGFLFQAAMAGLVIVILALGQITAFYKSTAGEMRAKAKSVVRHLVGFHKAYEAGNWGQAGNSLTQVRLDIRRLRAMDGKSFARIPGKENLLAILDAGERFTASMARVMERFTELKTLDANASATGKFLKPALVSADDATVALGQAVDKAEPLLKYLPKHLESKALEATGLAKSAAEDAELVMKILQRLTDEKLSVLLVLQNNNEIRATGGFWGTYGEMALDGGEIRDVHVDSIYDIDGQLEKSQKLKPPYPLLHVNPQWLLRDSNWSASFAESCKAILQLWKDAGRKQPDLVIALTPKFITRLLHVTGPLELAEYDITLDADNFLELSQLETSIAYDKIANEPKEMLSALMPRLLGKIASIEGGKMQEMGKAFQQSLLAKDIMLFSTKPELQRLLSAANWSGEVKYGGRDFLSIIRSNLGGTKTDTYIKEDVILDSVVNEAGEITNTLTITRSNPLPDRPIMKNLSFIRVLAPPGSELISSEGFELLDLDAARYDGLKSHPEALAWEEGMVKDLKTGMLIGQESGLTFFGNWSELKGGQTRTLKLVYKLPFRLQPTDHLSLRHQVQPGSSSQKISYSLRLNGYRIRYNLGLDNSDFGTNTVWQLPLDRDTTVGVVVKKD